MKCCNFFLKNMYLLIKCFMYFLSSSFIINCWSFLRKYFVKIDFCLENRSTYFVGFVKWVDVFRMVRKRRQYSRTHTYTHTKGGVTVDYWATALGYGNTSSVIRSAVLSPVPNSGLLLAQHYHKPGMHVFIFHLALTVHRP